MIEAIEFVQYENVSPGVDPEVIAAAVMSALVVGHTGGGLVATTVGIGLAETVTAFISEQPGAVVPLIK